MITIYSSPSTSVVVVVLELAVTLFLIVAATTSAEVLRSQQQHPLHRKIQIQNHADAKIDIAWVNPVSNEIVPMGESIDVNETIQYDTFVNHTFLIQVVDQALPSDTESVITAEDGTIIPTHAEQQNVVQVPINNYIPDIDESNNNNDSRALTSYLTISPDDDYQQVIVVQKGLQLERIDHRLLSTTTSKSKKTSKRKKNADVDAMMQLCQASSQEDVSAIVQCMKEQTTAALMELNDELAFQRELRRTVANLNENYTCTDLTRTTTTPIRTTVWSYPEDTDITTTRNVGILHEHDASQIHVIHDFISPEECMAIQSAAEPLLHRGTVADGKGGSTMSDNRKAWQAGVSTTGTNTDPLILNVKRRLFAYANHATGYNLTLDGQEDLMSIQYFGVNSNAPRATNTKDHNDKILVTPDRYTPHCDGDCTNSIHKFGSRIATMVMYCTIPEDGRGGTNFQQSNVYIKPTLGAGVYFSYMNPTTMIHDEGFTTHSGCPVLYGTKRIAVQWMRHGVDLDNPWDSFDTNNIKLPREEE